MRKKVIVVGAGASGLTAAYMCAKGGADVVLLEKNTVVGKKLSMTGNGRANLTNAKQNASCFNPEASVLVSSLLERYGKDRVLSFFHEIGILTRDEGGYFYPRSGEAAGVVRAMELAAVFAGVRLITSVQVKRVERITALCENDGSKRDSIGKQQRRFRVLAHYLSSAGDRRGTSIKKAKQDLETLRNSREYFECDFVILACGGLAGPATCMATGDGYYMAELLGIPVTPQYPALTGLQSTDAVLHSKTGIRVCAKATLLIDGEAYTSETGEVQITEGVLSGIPVMQFSRFAALYLKEGKQVSVSLDLYQDSTEAVFKELVNERLEKKRRASDFLVSTGEKEGGETQLKNQPNKIRLSDFLLGFAPSELNAIVAARSGLLPEAEVAYIDEDTLRSLLQAYRQIEFRVTGICDYDRAQVTAGGIRVDALSEDMESLQVQGLFAIGEVVDVDGRCGGYNLQFAFMSAMAASERILQ